MYLQLIIFLLLCTNSNALAKPSSSKRLRTLYTTPRKYNSPAILLPGIHDALSAKEYARSGAEVLFLSGFGVSATLGLPDLGLLTLTEMERSLRYVVLAAGDVPVIVDGDTGYGGEVNIRRTVRSFAAAGAAAVTIEDQVFPKKCAYAAGEGVLVVPRDECLKRIQAALRAGDEARDLDGNDIIIIARTDCRAALGLEEAIERCKMFEEAGADICYAENLQSREEYEKLRNNLKPSTGTILAQVQTGEKDQTLYSRQDIGNMKYDFGLFGISALQSYVHSLQKCATAMMIDHHASGLIDTNHEGVTLAQFDNVKESAGFSDYESF